MAWRPESVYKDVPYLHNCDATLICKKKLGLVLYSAPSSILTGNTYGVFYKRMKCSTVHEYKPNTVQIKESHNTLPKSLLREEYRGLLISLKITNGRQKP